MEKTSIITDLFQGKLQSQVGCISGVINNKMKVKCSKCGYCSNKNETFLDLAVDIPVTSISTRPKRGQKATPIPECI